MRNVEEDIFELEEFRSALSMIKMSHIIKMAICLIVTVLGTIAFKKLGVYTLDHGHDVLFGAELISYVMAVICWAIYCLK